MIEVNGLSKRFKMYGRPSDRLKEVLFRRSFHHSHLAVNDTSFRVGSGETLGIIGKNGAGKSTLLKLLTGVLQADAGDIQIDGRMTGLLELGTGFDMELSGLQNIISNALLLGMTMDEIRARREDIVAFSELGDYIGESLRTYSSGMIMRLAFSIAIHADPRCFVVDEALSVGDAHFQQKCMRRIKEFRAAGGSIIFVSHDLNSVKMLCDRALVMDNGRVVCEGTPEQAVNHYNGLIADLDEEDRLSYRPEQDASGYGNRECQVVGVKVGGADSHSAVLSCGEVLGIQIDIAARVDIEQLTIGVMIRDRFGQDIFGTNSHHMKRELSLVSGQRLGACFQILADIAPGQYTVTVALHDGQHHAANCYHWCDNVARFEVAGIRGTMFSGACRLNSELELIELTPAAEDNGLEH